MCGVTPLNAVSVYVGVIIAVCLCSVSQHMYAPPPLPDTSDLYRMLDDMSHDAENTDSRLKALTARVDKVSKKLGG